MHSVIIVLLIVFLLVFFFFMAQFLFFSKVIYEFLPDRVVLRVQILNRFSFTGFPVKYSSIQHVRKYDPKLDKWNVRNFGTGMDFQKYVVILRGTFFNPPVTFQIEDPKAFLEEMEKRLPGKVTIPT